MTRYEELKEILETLSDGRGYLFTLEDLSSAFPGMNRDGIKNLMSRSVQKGILERVCSGIYLNPRAPFEPGYVLYHTAAKLRASCFTYLSLETVLSEAGIISQMPISWISLMTSGRSYTFDCGKWGSIEYIHTKKSPASLANQLSYDSRKRLWRASVQLALQDMRSAGRSLDLIDMEALEDE
jgi:hypothetical protein